MRRLGMPGFPFGLRAPMVNGVARPGRYPVLGRIREGDPRGEEAVAAVCCLVREVAYRVPSNASATVAAV